MWKRQQLFHATDFQSLMYPNFMFCRVLGIFPYKIHASTFETSKIQNILQISFIGVFCIYDLIVLYKIVIMNSFYNMFMTLSAFCVFTLGGFIVIITYILSGPRMRVLQAVLNASSRLPPESYCNLSRWIHVKDILGTFVHGIMHAYYFKVSGQFWYQLLGIYMKLLIFQINMLYMNCVCILKTCFKTIDSNLVHLQDNVINYAGYVPRFIYDTQQNKLLLIKLKSLKKQHLIISNTFQTLNVIFSLQLLFTIALVFAEVTFEIYYSIFSHLTQWKNWLSFVSRISAFHDVYLIVNAGHQVLKLILVVWAYHTAKNQAFKIGTTIHDVLNCTSDKEIKEELHLFSLQVLHCARNTFTMKGFTMDATLLVAITGSITTYILILAQFMMISHSCDNKITSNITQIIDFKRGT